MLVVTAQEFQDGGIGGVDLYLACFGPALQVFSEHWPLKRGRPAQQPSCRMGLGSVGQRRRTCTSQHPDSARAATLTESQQAQPGWAGHSNATPVGKKNGHAASRSTARIKPGDYVSLRSTSQLRAPTKLRCFSVIGWILWEVEHRSSRQTTSGCILSRCVMMLDIAPTCTENLCPHCLSSVRRKQMHVKEPSRFLAMHLQTYFQK